MVLLRLAGANDLATANAVLAGYLPQFNAGFGVPPAEPQTAWRAVPDGLDPERVLCFKYRRKVARDHTLTLDGQILHVRRGRGRAGYAGRLIEVHIRLDGSLVGFDGTRIIALAPAPAEPRQLRAQRGQRIGPSQTPETAAPPWTPPAGHPWRTVRNDSALGQRRLTESLSR